ncbi:MAG: hypothetical protein ACKVPX_11470 [Myxococcaceae bacterium]
MLAVAFAFRVWLAAAEPPFSLGMGSSCADVVEPNLRYALTIELRKALLEKSGERLEERIEVAVDCAPRLFDVSVRISSGAGTARAVPREPGRARDEPRLLSLVIAELAQQLLRSHRSEARDVPVLDRAAANRATTSSRRFGFEVYGDARWVGRAFLGGGAVGANVSFSERWGLSIEAHYTYGLQAVALGDVHAHVVSLGSWLFLGAEWGAFGAQAGVGGHLGFAALRGTASQPQVMGSTVRGFWAAPSLVGKLRWRFNPNFSVVVRLEGGRTIAGIVGEVSSQRAVALEGWLGSVGAGIQL